MKDLEFIADQLINNESSSDKELIDHFVKELQISEDEAKWYVSQRDEFIGRIKSWEDLKLYLTPKQRAFLSSVKESLGEIKSACVKLNNLWNKDSDIDLDLNDYLKDRYPFKDSFDDFEPLIWEWCKDSEKNIDKVL